MGIRGGGGAPGGVKTGGWMSAVISGWMDSHPGRGNGSSERQSALSQGTQEASGRPGICTHTCLSPKSRHRAAPHTWGQLPVLPFPSCVICSISGYLPEPRSPRLQSVTIILPLPIIGGWRGSEESCVCNSYVLDEVAK